MTSLLVTLFAIFAPLAIFIVIVIVRVSIQRRKARETPAQSENPYEAKSPAPPNAFVRLFPSALHSFLREQWPTARFGFYACLWLSAVMLCGSLLPSAVADHHLPDHAQQVWYSYLTEIGIWSFIPIACAVIAAMIACFPLVMGATAAFYRTRPISLRALFWVRTLSAVAALVLSTIVAIGISLAVLRISYGPVWKSSPRMQTVELDTREKFISFDDDETPAHTVQRRLNYLAHNAAAPRLVSAVTTMLLAFAVMMVILCQPLGAKRSAIKALPFLGAVTAFVVYQLASSFFSVPGMRVLFYSGPFDAAPSWRFLPVPVLLAIALLFTAEQLYLRRDI